MNLTITGTMLDIVLILVFILSLYRGWKNGLVDSVIRLALTIIVLGCAWFFSQPFASFITLPEMAVEAELLVFITPLLQRAIAFVGLFIGLSIAKSFIYMLVKPILFKLMEWISVVDFVDSVLGAVFNTAKNVLVVNLLLACLSLPVVQNGQQILSESKASQLVLKASPSITEQLMEFGQTIVDFTQVENWATKEFETKDMIYLLNTMNEFDTLNSEHLYNFYQTYGWQISDIPSSQLEMAEYDEIAQMIEALPENEELKNLLRSKISY